MKANKCLDIHKKPSSLAKANDNPEAGQVLIMPGVTEKYQKEVSFDILASCKS